MNGQPGTGTRDHVVPPPKYTVSLNFPWSYTLQINMPKPLKHIDLPHTILYRIANILDESKSYTTIASLSQCSKAIYDTCIPVLYRRYEISESTTSTHFHKLNIEEWTYDLDKDTISARERDTYYLAESLPRRLGYLRYVEHLDIRITNICQDAERFFVRSAERLRSADRRGIFPRLKTVTIHPQAAEDIRLCPSYVLMNNEIPLLKALCITSNPKHLSLSFYLTPSDEWGEYQTYGSTRQYNLSKRISRLFEMGWDELESFTVHDITHQVLPSIPNCANIYHFAPHVLTRIPTTAENKERDYAFYAIDVIERYASDHYLPGRDDVLHLLSTLRNQLRRQLVDDKYYFCSGQESMGLPGFDWNFRPWQLGTAIKDAFVPNISVDKIIASTSWTFIDVQNHVLTGPRMSDDDEEEGVLLGMVEDLVKDCLETGMSHELLNRAGFDTDKVRLVLENVRFMRGSVESVVRASDLLDREEESLVRILGDGYREDAWDKWRRGREGVDICAASGRESFLIVYNEG